jgi:prefoldin subunit 5
MGEIRTWTDKNEYLNVLKKEIEVLKSRHDPNEEGTGHFNTAISVLQSRIEEIENELNWPFTN